jgi:hypothetical protein
MQPEPPSPIAAGVDTGTADEQVFSQWTTKRLTLYQEFDQQVQSNVAHMMEMARELMARMEAESENFLTRYRQQRAELQTQIDALQSEVSNTRAAIKQEQQAQGERLEKERREHETRLQQERQRARAEIEQEAAAAAAQREELLREAHWERDQVRAETQQLSARLAELQQALRGLLGPLTGQPAAGDPAPPLTKTTKLLEPVPEESVAAPATNGSATPAAEGAGQRETKLIIEGVSRFADASNLIDRIEALPSIEAVNQLQYEQNVLILSIRHPADVAAEELLGQALEDSLHVVQADRDTVRMATSR